jgi:hypothetical protein
MPKPKLTAEEQAVVALREGVYQAWCIAPMTVAMFRKLETEELTKLRAAARLSAVSAPDSRKEHDLLTEAKTIRKIIDRYARSSTYPFSDD